ncbi:hypothetical protein KC330_g146 [Hortaea werneckii]|nr:hypothetical protein KC330_g146 [Hortaea werneckii]
MAQDETTLKRCIQTTTGQNEDLQYRTREKPSPHRGWWWGDPCTSSQLASSTQLSVHHVASNNFPPSSHYPPFELVIKF